MAFDVRIFFTLIFFEFCLAITFQQGDFLPDQQKFEFSFVDDRQKSKKNVSNKQKIRYIRHVRRTISTKV